MTPLPLAEPVELRTENQIDSLCDAFETEWRSGKRPKIEDYLGETIAKGRATLLLELVRVDAYYRLKHGETPELQEYLRRFPQDAPDLSAGGLAQAFAAPATSGSEERESIGTFDLLEMLGEGAFGCVWKARDRKLDRIVALKLPRGAGLNAAKAAAFLREAQAAAQLRHPNIVAIYGVERDERTAYIISEYIDGVNLKEWLKQNQPTFEDAARLSVKLAEALAHAHAQGVVHRDMKPANILLDRAGEPHITDFGLAKRLSADISIHSGQHVLGTPAYMSPEQAAGDSKNVDPRSDLYSLGIILYELLTGSRAFDGDQQTILRLVLSAEPKPPRQVRPEIPASLETICLKAIAKERDQRYPSVQEFAADLNRFLRSEPVQARPPQAAHGGRQWTRRRFAGVALSAMLPVGGYALWSGVSGRREENFRPVALQTEPVGAEIWFIPLDKLTGEPDATRIIHAGRSPVSLELAPGDYLVEAVLDERRFHEVYRHVPDVTEVIAEGLVHRFSTSLPGQPIVLPIISIPDATVTNGMARISGDSKFALGRHDQLLASSRYWKVPPFYMDPFELTCGEFRLNSDGQLPQYLRAQSLTDRHAIPLKFDSAMVVAEHLGKRLPDAAEYEFAATSGGTRRYPWTGGTGEVASPVSFGPVDSFPLDRVDLDPRVPIFGLCSNVAEWTINWASRNPDDNDGAKPESDAPGEYRIVGGGNERVVEGDAGVTEETRDPRARTSVWRSKRKPGIGARFVRSVKPRLAFADFVRTLPEHTGNPSFAVEQATGPH
jgi:serine/threonine-protein kinase